jgi:hypothetical protein
MWILVFSYLLRLQKKARLEDCGENEAVDTTNMTMVRPLGKTESGRDLFVMALKE